MLKDNLIALRLWNEKQPEPPPAPVDVAVGLRASLERLFTLLRDFVALADFPDGGPLRTSLDEGQARIAAAKNPEAIATLIDCCSDAYRQVLAAVDGQRHDQKQEIASLVNLVHETLSIVSGDTNTLTTHIESSMGRFETIAKSSDVRQLKTLLMDEVGALRKVAAERRQSWEQTRAKFTERVSTLEHQLLATKQEASLDVLTQISNRGVFDRTVKEWVAAARPRFIVGLIDVDNFKGVNDTYGHPAGDRILVAVAQALKNSVRSASDLAARIGGDEFACLIDDVLLRQGESRLKMLVSSLAGIQFEVEGHPPFKISITCGLAELTAGDTVESLMQRADMALYEAKRLGKNCVVAKEKPTLRDMIRY